MYFGLDGERRTIYLGKLSIKDAHSVKLRVEELLSCLFVATSPARNTMEWVASISLSLRTKLSHHGLIDGGNLPKKTVSMSIRELSKRFIENSSPGKKPTTIKTWRDNTAALIATLGDVPIKRVTKGHARDWLSTIQGQGLAASTLHKRLQVAQQVFDYAVDHRLISENPFNDLSAPKPRGKSNVEVSRKDVDKILAECDPTWRAIVSLSRFGGLRCPSEVLSLKWSDIDFKLGTLSIPEPKVEHHDGRGVRLCPLFPEVRIALESLPRLNEWVIDKQSYRDAANTGVGWKSANLRTQFLKQLKAAGVSPWPRLFHSMRASRQTEVEREFGLPAACAWLGNTEEVAKESYLLVFESEWQRATKKPAQIPAQSGPIRPDPATPANHSDQ